MRILAPAQLCLPRTKYNGHWYVPTIDDKYLHSDLDVRGSTKNMETSEYTGFFKTEEEALAAVEEYNYGGVKNGYF